MNCLACHELELYLLGRSLGFSGEGVEVLLDYICPRCQKRWQRKSETGHKIEEGQPSLTDCSACNKWMPCEAISEMQLAEYQPVFIAMTIPLLLASTYLLIRRLRITLYGSCKVAKISREKAA
jgi:hypothetical protein